MGKFYSVVDEWENKIKFRSDVSAYHCRRFKKEMDPNGIVFGGAWRTAKCMEGGE